MTQSSMKNKNNGGYSLIELLVIISILAVFTGLIGYNIAVTSSFKARQCAREMESDIAGLKVTTLSKSVTVGDTYALYYVDGKKIMRELYVRNVLQDTKEFAKRVTVSFGNSTGGMQTLGDKTSGPTLKVIFNRSSGALVDDTGAVSNVDLIEVFATSDKKYTVELTPLTGKVVNKTRN